MARTRRYPSPWVLGFALGGSLALHLGAVAAYVLLKPPPPHLLHVRVDGPGRGEVTSTPAGPGCTRRCALPFAPGTTVELRAEPDEHSTFLGWSGDCAPRPDDILSCTLELHADAEVRASFGRMPREVQVSWLKVDEDEREQAIELSLPDPEIEAEMLVEPLAELLPELAPEPPPAPAPRVEEPPPEPPAPAQPPPEMANLRSVEVPDENEVEEAPEDATHLSDKNRDVAEETRAEDTNLEREQSGQARVSEQSDVQSEEVGAEEDVIAELEETEPTTLEDERAEESTRSGEHERAVGAVVGEEGQAGEGGEQGDGTEAEEPGVLAMRGIEGRGSLVDEDRAPGRGGDPGPPGERGRPGLRTELDFDDYERIVGEERAEEEVAMGRRRMSRRRGRWERKMEVMRSALENFTPDVRPGNQTALKTRAAPFAVYLARMHRRIHPLWGFGFLEDLNDKPSNHPLNDWDLQTTLEIVIDPDGTVHKVNIVRHSGRLEFDVAAIDAVMTGGPYEATPEEIRSPDGRVYLHWGFYRNYRQCGTFNSRPFILGEAPAEDADSVDDSDLVRRVPRQARQKMMERARAASPPARAGAGGPPSSEDPDAVHAANLWVTGFSQGNVARMLQVSATPFRSGAGFVASTPGEVRALYQNVLRETRGRMRDWKLVTPAGYRRRFGSLPEGVDPARPQLMAVVMADRARFALVLERQGGAYKVIGLYR